MSVSATFQIVPQMPLEGALLSSSPHSGSRPHPMVLFAEFSGAVSMTAPFRQVFRRRINDGTFLSRLLEIVAGWPFYSWVI